jgi:DNA-binding CsgD family transcriptional regulator
MRLDSPAGPALDHDPAWLALIDELYALAECTPGDAALRRGWPAPWRPLMARVARRLGAASVQIGALRTAQSPGCGPGLLSHRRITGGPVVSATSLSPEGFSAAQAQAFRAFCAHLDAALALMASLRATQQGLAALHGVVDALPLGVVVLDEHLEVVLLNRPARALLQRGGPLALHERRLCVPAQAAAFEQTLQDVAVEGACAHQRLSFDGLDVELQKLHGAPGGVLLLVHEGGGPARLREIAAPPEALARHLQREHGLSERELTLAWHLAHGMPLKQYAALSGRSCETARAQLKSVFRKLRITDQKSLGMGLFETLHAVSLQPVGDCVAAAVAARTAAGPEPLARLPWA